MQRAARDSASRHILTLEIEGKLKLLMLEHRLLRKGTAQSSKSGLPKLKLPIEAKITTQRTSHDFFAC